MFYSQPSLVVAHKEKGCEFESTQIQNILCKVCHFYFHLGWRFRSLFYHQHWSDAPRSHHMNEPWKTNQWSPSNRNNLHLLRFSQSNSSYFETQSSKDGHSKKFCQNIFDKYFKSYETVGAEFHSEGFKSNFQSWILLDCFCSKVE